MLDSAASKGGPTASQRITAWIAELNDWRGKILADLRTLILAADPDILRNGSGTLRYGHGTG